MGLFDIFKRRRRRSSATAGGEAPTVGWDAITRAFEAAYPGQSNPPHRAPSVYRRHDLTDDAAAFDGISAYDAGEFWHLVTYGLTELYGKEGANPAVSGFGYEFTFRVPKVADVPPPWAFEVLDVLGRAVWSGSVFGPGHTVATGALDGRPGTAETAVLVVRDPLFEPVETANGRFEFLLLLGIEDRTRQRVIAAAKEASSAGWESHIVDELRAGNPNLVTPIRHQGDWGADS